MICKGREWITLHWQNALQPGAYLVDGATVGASTEMTTRAGSNAVTAHLHVPEQCFTQSDGSGMAANVFVDVRRPGNSDCIQRAKRPSCGWRRSWCLSGQDGEDSSYGREDEHGQRDRTNQRR